MQASSKCHRKLAAKTVVTSTHPFPKNMCVTITESRLEYIPIICIMKEAKTTTQPQPPSGGVGRSPDESSVDPEDANDVPSASFGLVAAAASSFLMSPPDSVATIKIAPSSLSASSSSVASSSSSCVVGSVRVNSELFLLQVGWVEGAGFTAHYSTMIKDCEDRFH